MSVMIIHNDTDEAYDQNDFSLPAYGTRIFFNRVEDITIDQAGHINAMATVSQYVYPFGSGSWGTVPTYPTNTKLLVQVADDISSINAGSSDVRSNWAGNQNS